MFIECLFCVNLSTKSCREKTKGTVLFYKLFTVQTKGCELYLKKN